MLRRILAVWFPAHLGHSATRLPKISERERFHCSCGSILLEPPLDLAMWKAAGMEPPERNPFQENMGALMEIAIGIGKTN